ncbi:hypothetical protein TNCV_2512351 [Trichonephila clavipes]|nr:hypothetical protein TNCV_2512351 [Trichonephila clavipes]
METAKTELAAGTIVELKQEPALITDPNSDFDEELLHSFNGVAAEAVGFKDRSVTLRSSNGEAATEKGVESVEKKFVRDQGGRRVSLL